MSDSYKVYASKDYVDNKIQESHVQPDWNQNDETQPDYVKNRTHYAETAMLTALPEISFTSQDFGGGLYGWASTEHTINEFPEAGKVATVVFDGKEYACATVVNFGSFMYGNAQIMGGDDTGEPFFLMAKPNDEIQVACLTDAKPTVHSIALHMEKETVHTIDPKYLPEIPAEKLPEIPAEKLPDSITRVVQKNFEGSFDKVTDGRDKFVYNGFEYYKMSEFSPRREDVISFSGTDANGDDSSPIENGENCCIYGRFIVVYQAGQCTLQLGNFNAPSAGLYAQCTSGNDYQTAGTYNFTLRLVRNIIQSSTTFRRYYLDVDDSGALTAEAVTE